MAHGRWAHINVKLHFCYYVVLNFYIDGNHCRIEEKWPKQHFTIDSGFREFYAAVTTVFTWKKKFAGLCAAHFAIKALNQVELLNHFQQYTARGDSK